MNAVVKWLDGKKSVLGTLILGILGILASTGVVNIADAWVQIVILLVAVWTGISFHAAIVKSGATTKQ